MWRSDKTDTTRGPKNLMETLILLRNPQSLLHYDAAQAVANECNGIIT
jgi:hypothetical protein